MQEFFFSFFLAAINSTREICSNILHCHARKTVRVQHRTLSFKAASRFTDPLDALSSNIHRDQAFTPWIRSAALIGPGIGNESARELGMCTATIVRCITAPEVRGLLWVQFSATYPTSGTYTRAGESSRVHHLMQKMRWRSARLHSRSRKVCFPRIRYRRISLTIPSVPKKIQGWLRRPGPPPRRRSPPKSFLVSRTVDCHTNHQETHCCSKETSAYIPRLLGPLETPLAHCLAYLYVGANVNGPSRNPRRRNVRLCFISLCD